MKLELLKGLDLNNLDVTTKLTLDFIQRTVQSGATAKNTGLEIMMSETESETEEMNNTHFEDANETLNEEINRSFNGSDVQAREKKINLLEQDKFIQQEKPIREHKLNSQR